MTMRSNVQLIPMVVLMAGSPMMTNCQQQPSPGPQARNTTSAKIPSRAKQVAATSGPKANSSKAPTPLPKAMSDKLYGLTLTSLDGKAIPFATFRDKAVLVVNTASQCGYTPQYGGLQRLHERFAAKGLVVAGIPCNQFGGQEPGDAKAIRSFCTTRFSVTFPLFAKAKVKGEQAHPLYAILKQSKDADGKAGDVRWNFEKFLVFPEGRGILRFRSGIRPESSELVAAIQLALNKG